MTDRTRIFSRAGFLLAEFDLSVKRSHALGERGTASFDVSGLLPYCNESVLQFGNWLLIESDVAQDWIGTIASREWTSREVFITAYTPEHLFSQRIGRNERKVTGSPGAIFVAILDELNAIEPTIVEAGNIYTGGAGREETITPQKLSDDLRRIYQRSGEAYQFRPFVNPQGKLIVYADWLRTLGNDLQFTLREGKGGGNIEATSRVLVEDAPEANFVYGYGNGQTWGSKPKAYKYDSDSIARYGLIQKSVNNSGVSTIAAIESNCYDELQKTKNPYPVYNVNALNVGDTLANCGLGNTLNLEMENVGFTDGTRGTSARVRITGWYYDPAKGRELELALERI